MASISSMNIVVIGAGIIGAAVAYELQKRGYQVTLVDRDAPGRGASFGNMASIAVTEFMPASRPAIWRQMPGWLLHSEGPVRVRGAYLPKLVPWFWRFLAASRPGILHEIEAQGAALCQRALPDTKALMAEIGLSDHLSQEGCLALFANEAEFRASRAHRSILKRFGFEYEVLGHNVLHALEPEISNEIQKAILFPDNRSLVDPYRLAMRLIERFEALGGKMVHAEVTGFEKNEQIAAVLLHDGSRLLTDNLVISAGAFSAQLSKMLGEPIPLETERGYSTQIMAPGIKLRHSIIWPAKAFMVAPTAGGIRVGGTVEFAGLDAPPDFARAKVTVKHARVALPNLKVEQATQWMGHRPALPDTIPLIARSAKTRGVFYATGHGHLGVTLAATTARLIGQMVAGERPDVEMHPYRIERFRMMGDSRPRDDTDVHWHDDAFVAVSAQARVQVANFALGKG